MTQFSILNHPLIGQRYFFPRQQELPRTTYVDCGDAQLACYYYAPHPNGKTIVHFHGNGEIVADYLDDFVEAVTSLGVNCFLAEYRGFGASTGEPALQTMLGDVEKVIETLKIPPSDIIFFGRSVGSLYALHGVHHFKNVAGLILESGIADCLERLILRIHPREIGCTINQLRQAVDVYFNHRQILQNYQGPALIMHTKHDRLVDLSHAQRLYEWAAGPKFLKVFEVGNHNTVLAHNFPDYMDTLRTFFETL